MPRDRKIKTEFWEDVKMQSLPDSARLLYMAIWNFSDDKGRSQGDAADWRARVWKRPRPVTKVVPDAKEKWGYRVETTVEEMTIAEVEFMLDYLQNEKRIIRYELSGQEFLCAPFMMFHQWINKPSPSRLPKPPKKAVEAIMLEKPDYGQLAVDEILDDQPWTSRKRENRRSGGDGAIEPAQEKTEAKEVKAKKRTGPATPENGDKIAKRLLAEWIKVTDRDKGKVLLNKKRREKIYARLNEGYPEDEMRDAIRGIVLSEFHMGDNDRNKVYDDITTILRDGGQVEKFRDLYRSSEAGKAGEYAEPVALADDDDVATGDDEAIFANAVKQSKQAKKKKG